MDESLLVRKIDWGTVLDHIPAWSAEQVIRLLNLKHLRENPDVSLIVLQNVPSRRLGRKDIVKLYHYMVAKDEAGILALIFPTITINYIRDWKVEKEKPGIPERIVGRIKCPETSCITNLKREPAVPRFEVRQKHGVIQCRYCDTLLEIAKIPEYLI
jgi:aspartate carbamoyltransferase regulatory subunit